MSTALAVRQPLTIDQVLDRARAQLTRVSARQAHTEYLDGALLVDIRPAAQRTIEGEVPGALVIERNVLEWRLDPRHRSSLPIADLELRVILICQEGYTSSLAADMLLRLGVHRSTDVIGGFGAWVAAELPTRPGLASTPEGVARAPH